MTDQAFLRWLHNRLFVVHGEPLNIDFMHKLRGIIVSMDPDQETILGTINTDPSVLDKLPKRQGVCDRPEGCVCGGDLPAIREGCGYWRKD